MTSAYDRYRAADLDLPDEAWAWHLWGAGEESFHGRNDEVSPSNAANISTSLVLLRPKKLVVVVRDESRFVRRPPSMRWPWLPEADPAPRRG